MAKWIFICLGFIPSFIFGQSTALIVEITDIGFKEGLIRLGMYDHPDQFPKNPSRTYDFEKTLLRDGTMEVVLIDIPPGTYVISMLDDINGNDQMDFKLIKIPKEGYGFSNNVKPGLKHPPYDKCSFQVLEGQSRIRIQMQYFKNN